MPATTPPTQTPDAARHFAAQWLDEHGDRLFSYAMARVGGDSAIAEDLVQETLIAGIRGYESFKGKATIATWLTSILRRKIIDHYRSISRNADRLSLEESPDVSSFSLRARAWSTAAASRVESAEFQEVFDHCLTQLRPEYAEAFRLCVMDELSTREACSLLGVTPTNLSVRLHRARAALRSLLQNHWFEAE